MKAEIKEFLEKLGFTLCIHERDFLVGESIPANIEAAINHSRRMIMIISRSVNLQTQNVDERFILLHKEDNGIIFLLFCYKLIFLQAFEKQVMTCASYFCLLQNFHKCRMVFG